MIMEKYITQNGIKYELKGEQYYPMLGIAEQKERNIGKYGLLYRDYIKQHKRGTYTTFLTEGKLNAHLHEIDVQANEMVEAIVANLARERGIDEELKASDALKWAAYTYVIAALGSLATLLYYIGIARSRD